MSEHIRSIEALRGVLDNVTMLDPLAAMRWRFTARAVAPEGWLVRAHFNRPDRDTGLPARGLSREEFIPWDSTVSFVVKTCWVLVELVVTHEAREAFHFDGDRVFDPHHEVEALARLARA